jgi:zinc transporter
MTGSDISNEITGLLLNGEGGATAIGIEQLRGLQADSGTVWLHLDYTNARHQQWLIDESGLDPIIIEALSAEETRPRSTAVEDGLLIALRGVNLNPGADPHDMVSIRIWVEKNRIITTHKRDLVSVNDLMDRLRSARGPRDSAEFLVDLADRIVWRMSNTVDQLEDTIAEFEDRTLEGDSSDLRYELACLRRQAISLRRYLAPQREALARLTTEKVSWLDESHRLQLREVSDRLIRHIEDLDAVREQATVTHEELLSRLSDQINTRMYVLSLVAAVFLPLGFLTGMFGINVGGIPGAENAHAFWIFSGVLVVLVVFQIIIFRWKKWL